MKRTFRGRLLRLAVTLLLVTAVVLPILVINAPLVKADTNVCGFITEDTTWTLENSPYIVTCGVIVVEGVTLTIEPGVVVKFDSNKALQIDGQLIAQGAEAEPIVFTSNQTSPSPGDWAYILFTDTSVDAAYDADGNYLSGCIMQYCTVEYGGYDDPVLRIESSSPFIDHCNIRNNANTGIKVVYGSPKLTNNVISNNSARYGYGGGIYIAYGTVTISDNIITDNSASSYRGGGICIYYATVTICGNTITDNSARDGGGIDIYNYRNEMVTVSGNTITNNSASDEGGGIYVRRAQGTVRIIHNNIIGNKVENGGKGGGIYVKENPTINCNNIYDNIPYNVYNANSQGSTNVDATNNWWCTTDPNVIEDGIWHWPDDPSRGIVEYIPYLPVEYICGDVDCDGKVTMNDGRQIFMYLIYGEDLYPLCDPCAADCDGVEGITMNDGRQIFMHLIYGPDDYPLVCE